MQEHGDFFDFFEACDLLLIPLNGLTSLWCCESGLACSGGALVDFSLFVLFLESTEARAFALSAFKFLEVLTLDAAFFRHWSWEGAVPFYLELGLVL